jgi:hypothetical protein
MRVGLKSDSIQIDIIDGSNLTNEINQRFYAMEENFHTLMAE